MKNRFSPISLRLTLLRTSRRDYNLNPNLTPNAVRTDQEVAEGITVKDLRSGCPPIKTM